MIELVKSFVTKSLGFLLPWVMRKLYPEEKLKNMMDVMISSEYEAVTINCQNPPSARVCLEVTNRSPFTVKITGVECEIEWAGTIAKLVSIKHEELSPNAKIQIFLRAPIGGRQADFVLSRMENMKPRIITEVHSATNFSMYTKLKDAETTSFRVLGSSAVPA
ncbi:hypothetical protein [Microbulbifer sp. SAOS-129_SWC]|uniref:hypothetical protein n=1 Tax=Microbulbifer sp. SAOS-129_SWC TaxID=3145235 RepID=UPI0032170C65